MWSERPLISDVLSAVLALQFAACANDRNVAACEPELRAVALALGAKRVESSTLRAIMAAYVSITDGLPLSAVQRQFGTKPRNIQKWKRDLSTVLLSSADRLDLSQFPNATVDSDLLVGQL